MFLGLFLATLAVNGPDSQRDKGADYHADDCPGRGLVHSDADYSADEQPKSDKNSARKAGLTVFCS
jgi:hypothetical protein